MSVVNKYASPNYASQKLDAAGFFGIGTAPLTSIANFQMTGDSVLSVYRIFKGIPSDATILKIEIVNDAWTNCTSINIGLYGVFDFDGVGAVVGAGNQLVAAYDPHSATTDWTNMPMAMSVVNHAVPLWTLAGQAEYPPKFAAFDIGLSTVTNSGTATPNLVFKMSYIRGV